MISKHIRPDIQAMADPVAAFAPPEVVAARQGLPLDRIVKLDANENVYGPSPKVLEALAAGRSWSLYPEITHRALNEALAAYNGVNPGQVIATNGGDELILMLVQLVMQPGMQVIDSVPTFGFYEWAVRALAGQMIAVPRRQEAGYALDVPAMLRSITDHTRLIFLCNPNNPTGGLTPQKDIEALLQTGALVAVDETYREFSGVTMAHLLATYDNLIIIRSMSKWAGLAGLRVGYGIVHPDLARQIRKLRQPFNVNQAGYVAALASLDDVPYLHANVARIVHERERLFALLCQIPFLTCYPSHGNFIMCDVSGVSARALRDEMEREGVLVRVFQNAYLPNAIRISVGKPEHSDAAIAALRSAGRRLKLL